jgi:hypothetical protein
VPAGVVEGAHDIVLAAHDEYGRAGFLPQQIAAALGQFIDVTGVQPAAMPEDTPIPDLRNSGSV